MNGKGNLFKGLAHTLYIFYDNSLSLTRNEEEQGRSSSIGAKMESI